MKILKIIVLCAFATFINISASNSCTVSVSCGGDEESISCTGNESCDSSVSEKSVTCDGVTTKCPSGVEEPMVIAPN